MSDYVSHDDVFSGYGVEVELRHPDDFLKVMETLTRIGIQPDENRELVQLCHILHKRGKYAVMHYKELYALDGKDVDMTEEDLLRRNTVAKLLDQWNLLTLAERLQGWAPMSEIKVITFREKADWRLRANYTFRKGAGAYAARRKATEEHVSR